MICSFTPIKNNDVISVPKGPIYLKVKQKMTLDFNIPNLPGTGVEKR